MAAQQEDILVRSELEDVLPLVARGKVRDVYAIDNERLLFVATDRVSAYDVVMQNGIPHKGALLTTMSAHWFSYLQSQLPTLRTHFLTLDLPPAILNSPQAPQLRHRSMQVRRLNVFPIESIVRGYITGSAWSEYKKSGTVHGMCMPEGLRESEKLERPLWTPSTKAEAGGKDENISPERAAELIGADYAKRIEELSLALYTTARDYALERGIIIADTKFEFALDPADPNSVVLVDEVLTPDSSRFWPAATYEVGRGQASLDKQVLRDWLTENGLKGKESVVLPEEVVRKTFEGYREAFERIVGRGWVELVKV